MSILPIVKPVLLLAVLLATTMVSAQNYPNKPIRVLTNPPGGSPDFVARIVVPALSTSLGQQVIVDNRRAQFAIEAVAKASPDGYTFVITGSALWLLPFLRSNVPWDPIKDFSPVTLAISSPTVLVVHPASPINSVKDLIDAAKANPGGLNYGAGGSGTTSHLAAELFVAMTRVNITRVNYKGAGAVLIAVAGDEVQTTFATTSSVTPHIKAGRLRALAVTSAKPSALVPGLPTVAAVVPGYEALSIIGVFAPAKTPTDIIKRLSHEIARALNATGVKEKLFNTGVEAVGSSPDYLETVIKAEMARMGKVIKDAGIREN